MGDADPPPSPLSRTLKIATTWKTFLVGSGKSNSFNQIRTKYDLEMGPDDGTASPSTPMVIMSGVGKGLAVSSSAKSLGTSNSGKSLLVSSSGKSFSVSGSGKRMDQKRMYVKQVTGKHKSPHTQHWDAAIRVLRYLKGAPGQGLLLLVDSALQIRAFCESDWPAALLPVDLSLGISCP